jgi:uncharacterized iron-regulated membrane protein
MAAAMTQEASPDAEDGAVESGADRDARRDARGGHTGLFRAFWRWHFYASLLVVPVFAILAVTGLMMLCKWWIDPIQEPALRYTPPAYGAMQPLSVQEKAALAGREGATVTAVQTAAEDRSTYFTLTTADNRTLNVYVDPYTGKVLGEHNPDTLLSNVASQIHRTILFGDPAKTELGTDPFSQEPFTVGSFGDRLIETATCWAIVMALTGYYLYWRGRTARAAAVAKRAAGALTRSRHAKVGAIAGVGILFMMVSALPWTGLFGHTFQRFATGTSLSMWGNDPGATSNLGAKLVAAGSNSLPAPWAEGAAPLPTSGSQNGKDMPGMPGMGSTPGSTGTGTAVRIGIDVVMAAAARDGLTGPLYIAYPAKADDVFSAMTDMWHDKAATAFGDVGKERVVHIDQYSGAVAGRYSYDQYSPVAKAVSQGIALHEGQRFGTLSFWASFLFCVAVFFLCVTAPMMWWRRRRSGLDAPRGHLPIRSTPWLIAALVILGVVFPLFGLTLVLVLLADKVLIRRSARLATVFNSTPASR